MVDSCWFLLTAEIYASQQNCALQYLHGGNDRKFPQIFINQQLFNSLRNEIRAVETARVMLVMQC